MIAQDEDGLDINIDSAKPNSQMPGNEMRRNGELVRLLRNAVQESSDDSGWSSLSAVGSYISNNSSFSTINFGYSKLGDLVREIDLFEVEMRKGSGLFVKAKPSRNGKSKRIKRDPEQ